MINMRPRPRGWAPWGPYDLWRRRLMVPMNPEQRASYLEKRRTWVNMRKEAMFSDLQEACNGDMVIREIIVSSMRDYEYSMLHLV